MVDINIIDLASRHFALSYNEMKMAALSLVEIFALARVACNDVNAMNAGTMTIKIMSKCVVMTRYFQVQKLSNLSAVRQPRADREKKRIAGWYL